MAPVSFNTLFRKLSLYLLCGKPKVSTCNKILSTHPLIFLFICLFYFTAFLTYYVFMCVRKALIYRFIYFYQFTGKSVCHAIMKKDKNKGWSITNIQFFRIQVFHPLITREVRNIKRKEISFCYCRCWPWSDSFPSLFAISYTHCEYKEDDAFVSLTFHSYITLRRKALI